MASVNKVILVGHLGKDPELRNTQGGSSVCNMVLATDESFTDRDGNKHDAVEWHKVTAFAKQADNCAKFLHKGSLIYVEGSLRTRKWQSQDGTDRYSTEIKADRIQFLDSKNGGGNGGQLPRQSGSYQPSQPHGRQEMMPESSANSDSVPF